MNAGPLLERMLAAPVLLMVSCAASDTGSAARAPADASDDSAHATTGNSPPDATDADAAAGPTTVSYARDVQPIWDAHCNGCHNFHLPHLVAPHSREELAKGSPCTGGQDRPYVVPGSPEKSFLIYKLTGSADRPVVDLPGSACTRLMPADVDGRDVPLSAIDPGATERVRTWIREGALDN